MPEPTGRPSQLPVYIIDAFASAPMNGNPAAVCPLQHWLAPETMQAIAAELNLSETVFFAPKPGRDQTGPVAEYDIRWFTPTREVDMIGHATLAAGHLVLGTLAPTQSSVRFFSPTAEMQVRRTGTSLEIAMPALVPAAIAEPEGLSEALGRKPSAVLAAKHYLVVYDSPDDIATLTPNFEMLSRLPLPGVIVTARSSGDFDFVSRFFAPANGVPEDPVSGVAHCCLTPYWARVLSKSALVGRQLSKRGGTIACELHGDQVRLRGGAVTFLEGTISL